MSTIIPFPDYEINELIYEGQNTHIYRGVKKENQLPVIIKKLKSSHPTSMEILRLKREFEIAAKLKHPNIVKAYDFINYQSQWAVIFEDFGGMDLYQLQIYKQADIDFFLDLALKLLAALGYIHSQEIIHKDIKPRNIIINPDSNEVKITDFGIASQLSKENNETLNPDHIEGTLPYISPEQTGRMNRSIDYRTDFYSLGITFYEILTGELPFYSSDQLEMIYAHIAKIPLPLNQLNSTIPKVISDIVLKMLAKNAEDRYQSSFGLKCDLEKCQKQLLTYSQILDFPIALNDVKNQFHIPQKLYGREEEIQLLMDGFKVVSKGKTRLMLVNGYSGIGKTVLIKELYKPITQVRGFFISGKFNQFQQNIPYSAFIDALKELIKQILVSNDKDLIKWKNNILSVLKNNAQVVIDVIPELEYIIGKQTEVPELPPIESQNRFNLEFKKFISIFTQQSHPLTLFLDDLQWVDSASLNLIQILITDPDTKYLYLIGAYRDNEVDSSHTLMMALDEILKNKISIHQIHLKPLTEKEIEKLIADTLESSDNSIRKLANLVNQKTNANPFFIISFLKTLYVEDLIHFNFEQGKWILEIDKIEKKGITENVVDLMLGNLQKLSSDTQNILKIASSIGSKFNLKLLSLIYGHSMYKTLNTLWPAVQEGLILTFSDISYYNYSQHTDYQDFENIEDLEDIEFKFLHDRVQEAAYLLLDSKLSKELHLKIGRLYMSFYNENDLKDNIFDIVNHFNISKELIKDYKEQLLVCKLNLKAGKKAKLSTAYQSALNYLSHGMTLLKEDSWMKNYYLTFEYYLERYETENLIQNYQNAEQYFEEIIKNSKEPLEKAKAYLIKIPALAAQNRQVEGIKAAKVILKELGIDTPLKVRQIDILKMLVKTKLLIAMKKDHSILDAKTMSDPYKAVAVDIMIELAPSSYVVDQNFLALTILISTHLSYKYGLTQFTPYAVSLYGLLHAGALKKFKEAATYAKIAQKLLDKLDTKFVKSKVCHINYNHNLHRTVPISNLLQPTLEGVQAGIETGDFNYATYCLMGWIVLIFNNHDLSLLKKDIKKYYDIIHKFKQKHSHYYYSPFAQLIEKLVDTNLDDIKLQGSYFDIDKEFPELSKTNDNLGLLVVHYNKALLYFFFGKYNEALIEIEKADQYSLIGMTHFFYAYIYFYYSLILLALYPEANKEKQKLYMSKLQGFIKLIKLYTNAAPMNLEQAYFLVLAEKAKTEEKYKEAAEYYDKSIQKAKENNFYSIEALACELAAKYYFSIGNEIKGKFYLLEAHSTYKTWGTNAKVKQLEINYKQYFHKKTDYSYATSTNPSDMTSFSSTITTIQGLIDLDTIIKASQTLSSEIMLDKIIENMMTILIENAGARKGILLLNKNELLHIEAEINIESKSILLLKSIPIESRDDFSKAICIYAARTKENVILHNAASEGSFTETPYILKSQTKSILATPLLFRDKVIGVIYLENEITKAAFTDDRVELIKVISSQAAISIEIAGLIEDLKEQERLKQEMEIAQRIQTSIVPKAPLHNELEITVEMKTAGKVGGDYYDILFDKNNRLWFAIGDVSGHGVTPGIIMLMAQSSFASTILQNNKLTPKEAILLVNEVLFDNVRNRLMEKHFMTMNILSYEGKGEFKYAGVHEDILIYRSSKQEIERKKVHGLFLSLRQDISQMITEQSFQLEKNDILILFTDGIIEAKNDNNELFGLNRLLDILLKHSHNSLKQLKDLVINDVLTWSANKLVDDITLLLAKRKL